MLYKLVALALAAFASAQVTDCGGSNADVKFSSLSLTPMPPIAGQAAVLNATGTSINAVTGGSGLVTVNLDGSQLYQTQVNTCGETDISLPLGLGTVTIYGLSCPTTAGSTVSVSAELTLPSIAPPGAYEVQLSANDQGNNVGWCVDAQFSL